jgi:hypothetical protein
MPELRRRAAVKHVKEHDDFVCERQSWGPTPVADVKRERMHAAAQETDPLVERVMRAERVADAAIDMAREMATQWAKSEAERLAGAQRRRARLEELVGNLDEAPSSTPSGVVFTEENFAELLDD